MCIDSASAVPDAPWTAYIQGPLGTFWEDAIFRLEIVFPGMYPWQPLQLRFVPAIFHPNVALDGTICNRLATDHWSPALGPAAILTYTRALLASPNFSTRDGGEAESEEALLAADEEARRIGGLDFPRKVYHYTCREAVTSISGTWELKSSKSGIYGPGVYATALHPTNCTKSEIERNNWGCSTATARTDFVIELDVAALQEQMYTVEKHSQDGRDIWLIQKLTGESFSILLNDSNSTISDFDSMSSCVWNKEAGRLFMESSAEYQTKVSETIRTFGQLPPIVAE